MRFITLLLIILFTIPLYASDHGIYLNTVADIDAPVSQVKDLLLDKISQSKFTLLYHNKVKTPDYVREDTSEYCGFKAHLFVLVSEEYTSMITSYGNKYLVAGFIRIGLYETPDGVQITMANPETINRIIFNDLDDEKYKKAVTESQVFRKQLVELTQSVRLGKNIEIEMEPIRDDEDLREASRDMFMMVGPLTFFQDEDQFPLIYSQDADSDNPISDLYTTIKSNLKKFAPTEDDIDYRWTPEKNDLQWQIISELYAPDSSAFLLGITRPRTEALSFRIAGEPREEDYNTCPGIDHVTAYPVEVLIIREDDKINVYSAREMFRMDMYFWDAGKMAFMDYMQMPGMLDESIKNALFNITED